VSSLRAPRPKGRVGPAPAVTLPAGSATAECAQPPALVYVLVVLLAPQILSGTHCPAPLRRQCAPLGSAPLSTIYHWCTRDYRAIVVLIWCANLGIIPWGKRMALAFTLRCPSRRGGGGARRGGRATSCCCRRTAQLMEDVEGLETDVLLTFLCKLLEIERAAARDRGRKFWGSRVYGGGQRHAGRTFLPEVYGALTEADVASTFPPEAAPRLFTKSDCPGRAESVGGVLLMGATSPNSSAWRRRGPARGDARAGAADEAAPSAAVRLHHPRPQGCTIRGRKAAPGCKASTSS